MARTTRTRTSKSVGLKYGFRSGLEEKVAEQLRGLGVSFRYEAKQDRIEYTRPSTLAKYTPDFVLPNGIIVETKGRFMTADRKKHLLIREQFPHKDIRFVFSNPNARLYKGSPTTYAKWCEKHGFQYAKATIPEEWVNE
jgi:hypothetical protein